MKAPDRNKDPPRAATAQSRRVDLRKRHSFLMCAARRLGVGGAGEGGDGEGLRPVLRLDRILEVWSHLT